MYHRYHLETAPAADIVSTPGRFQVKVQRHRLALLLLKELVQYRANRQVVLSRPCVYGVFSGPIGGFAPREHLCVGCLRCTTQYPEIVQIYPNPARNQLGDSYFHPGYVESIHYEARTGRIPVKGAGYRGPFGGEGWDGMWTDMSEIVRPTRDGIHGREFISTSVEIGSKPPFLTFNEKGQPMNGTAQTLSVPIPIFLDAPPASLRAEKFLTILSAAAEETDAPFLVPASALKEFKHEGRCLIPLVAPNDRDALKEIRFEPAMIEMDGWTTELYGEIQRRFPRSIVSLRLSASPAEELLQHAQSGIRVFHLVADYHGRGQGGRFIRDVIREAHKTFVDAGCRDEVTLLASGGIIAAEHVAKAIISGVDAVFLDTPILVALQAEFLGEGVDRETSRFRLPEDLSVAWGVQRITNLLSSWRDQLLEVMGAMGMREVRRLRGEVGRAMFQSDLEQEAFAGIEGYGQ